MTTCVWRILCLLNASSVSYFRQPPNLPTSARRNQKCTECGTTAFGRNRMSAEIAHLSTFGAETENEVEIRSTSSDNPSSTESRVVATGDESEAPDRRDRARRLTERCCLSSGMRASIRLSTSSLLRLSADQTTSHPLQRHPNLTMYHAAVALTTRNWRQRCFHGDRLQRRQRRCISDGIEKTERQRNGGKGRL